MRRPALPALALIALPVVACGRQDPSVTQGTTSLPVVVASAPAPVVTASAPVARRCDVIRCASIETCDEAAGACVPACPAGEVYIPRTSPEGFVMGKGFTLGDKSKSLGRGHLTDSDAPHRVVLTRPFCMDETEVTVAAMKACVEAGSCDAPKIYEVRANYPKKLDHPSNETSWFKAKKFCEAHDKTLPTEAQWEWAATGGDGRKWPWGDTFPDRCDYADFTIGPLISPGGDSGCHGGGTSKVKAHPLGNRVWPTGVLYDLAGNVWEWCLDTYAPYPRELQTDPWVNNPRVMVHVVRGGGWNRPARGIESAFRGAAIASYEVGGLGFRCVRNPR